MADLPRDVFLLFATEIVVLTILVNELLNKLLTLSEIVVLPAPLVVMTDDIFERFFIAL